MRSIIVISTFATLLCACQTSQPPAAKAPAAAAAGQRAEAATEEASSQIADIPSIDLNDDTRRESAAQADRWPGVMSTAMRSSDLERTRAFYENGLGMVLRGKVEFGDFTEIIFGFPGREEASGLIFHQTAGPDEAKPVNHGDAKAKVIVGVPDIDVMRRRILDAGYEAGDIKANGPYRIMMVRDPDGYLLEIVQPPSAS